MSYKYLFFSLLFTFSFQNTTAQLVSWSDLIEVEGLQADHRIYFGDDSLQFGDLWLPDGDISSTIILIHGGCWLSAYPGVELMNPMAAELRKQGFAIWNMEYRRIGHDGGGYPGTFLDIANGADYLNVIAEEYRLDLSNIIVAGHSAGGHLATWLASRKNIDESSPLYTPEAISVSAAISLAGINDLERYARYGSSSCGANTIETLVDLENRSEGAYLDTSPLRLLPIQVPFVEVVAAFDAPVPPFFGYHFVETMKNSGDDASLVLLPNAGHFEMISPWTDEWKTVLELFNSF
tara:strand:- start:4009 stop:4887 length:879 start_codon:yes stop_codon:yes gene_type:complete